MPHLRVRALRRVNGWDAWNVTEDADLGARLARFGYRVGALPSTTFEEAPFRFPVWLGQRRRWLKGYTQTLVVHLRQPRRVVRELGPRRALALFVTLAGTLAGALFGPALGVVMWVRIATGRMFRLDGFLSEAVDTLSLFVVVVGTASVFGPAVLGLLRRGRRDVAAVALLPLYYCCVSLAAWLALWHLWSNPFDWTKTPHGFARRRRPNSGSRGGDPSG